VVVTDKVTDLASRGYRALGVALAEGEGAAHAPGTKWEYVGLVPLFDPPRHDTKATIERCAEQSRLRWPGESTSTCCERFW
jgi:H+-transporting ATPase